MPSPLGEGGTSASEANRVTNEGTNKDGSYATADPSPPPTAEVPYTKRDPPQCVAGRKIVYTYARFYDVIPL